MKCPQNTVKTQQYRIFDHSYAVIIVKETLKPFQSYPRTSKKASNWIVITESNLYTIHWDIFKNNCQNDAWKQQHIKLPMLCDLLPQIFLRNRHCSFFMLFPSFFYFECYLKRFMFVFSL